MATIILIEDRDSHQDMIAGMLRDMQYDVLVCGCLSDVQALVPTLKVAPKGILLDLQIPPIPPPGPGPTLETGRDCGLYLRSQPITSEVPIIAYSAYSDDVRVPGWADIIRFSSLFKKHIDPVGDLEQAVRRYFV
jgi:CheY-like chemotaxis protein